MNYEKEYMALLEELSRHVYGINGDRMLEFRSYYTSVDPDTQERRPCAKLSESPALARAWAKIKEASK